MTDKIKSCPFCGGEKLKIDCKSRRGLETYSVRCNKCHARGGTASLHVHSMVDTKGYAELKSNREIAKKQAIIAWNTRKPMDRIVEQLEELAEDARIDACPDSKYRDGCIENCQLCYVFASIKIVKGGGGDEV